ncbi:hypothetical protein GCM10010145_08880 [Streptomyces ruber]|uniref:Uncharacterized protein n=2 Tax=Streptomyces TaxID=1883 RepID=A0A918B8B1_9ACTN|nr:hypothetical protein [Streptomyces ruber]GGQ42340.1 hypothetical protein GCM10010145_08880 [Streptomyces ruber]
MRSLMRSVLVGCATAGLALAGSASAHAGGGGDEGNHDTRVGINKEVHDSGWGSGNGNGVLTPGGGVIFGSFVQD